MLSHLSPVTRNGRGAACCSFILSKCDEYKAAPLPQGSWQTAEGHEKLGTKFWLLSSASARKPSRHLFLPKSTKCKCEDVCQVWCHFLKLTTCYYTLFPLLPVHRHTCSPRELCCSRVQNLWTMPAKVLSEVSASPVRRSKLAQKSSRSWENRGSSWTEPETEWAVNHHYTYLHREWSLGLVIVTHK